MKIDQRSALLLGDTLHMVLHFAGQALDQRAKILEPHPLGSQEALQSVAIADRLQGPAKDHAVKAAQHTLDLMTVLFEKTFHDSLRHNHGIMLSSCAPAGTKARYFCRLFLAS